MLKVEMADVVLAVGELTLEVRALRQLVSNLEVENVVLKEKLKETA